MHRGWRSGGEKNQVKMSESAFFYQMRLEQKRETREWNGKLDFPADSELLYYISVSFKSGWSSLYYFNTE